MASTVDTDLEDRFDKAAKHVQIIAAKLDSNNLLELYGLYKQATCGTCNTPQPNWFNVTAKRKWEAWKNLGAMSKPDAMNKYIMMVSTLDPDWEDSDDENGDKSKDPFNSWVSVSCPVIESDDDLSDTEKTLLDWAKEGVLTKVQELASAEDINQWDEEGMTALHWAADRGNEDMLKCLLQLGADINFQDSEGQTALHYGASCGHNSIVSILLHHQANTTLVDREGDTPADVASSPEIAELLKHNAQASC